MFQVEEALAIVGGKLLNPKGSGPRQVKNLGALQFDSRKLEPGETFVALAGEQRDGHEFIESALERGAKAVIVVEKIWEEKTSAAIRKRAYQECWVIAVSDCLAAIGILANAWRRKFSIPVFAVTGSNGKTTTKDMLGHVLNQVAKKENGFLYSLGSFNNNIGVPRTLSLLNEAHEGVVLEVGTNHFGELAALAKIAEPTGAIITNIGDSHLEHLRDRRGVLTAKWELVEGLTGKNKTWFVNIDDPILKRVSADQHRGLRKVTFSRRESQADFYVGVVDKLGEEGNYGYRLRFSGSRVAEEVETDLRVPGLHNVHNALAAFAVSVDFFGKSPLAVAEALRSYQSVSKYRSEILQTASGWTIFNDCYNANPSSVEAAVKMISDASEGKFAVAIGELLEVGGRPDEVHFRLGETIAKAGAGVIGASGPHAEDVMRGAKSAGLDGKDLLAVESPEKLESFFHERRSRYRFLLVKGSRGAHMEKLVEKLKGEKS